jgi:outer membrane protein assembly factor BamB
VGDLVYIGSCSGTLFALDRNDGRTRWSHDVKPNGRATSFHGDALVADSVIVVGTDGGNQEDHGSHILAFALDRGAVRWTCAVEDGIVSDIVRAGDRILAITRADSLLCLDLNSGRRLWSFPGGADGSDSEFIYRSPAVVGARAFFGDARGRVHALDLMTGRSLWTRPLGTVITTGILAMGDELVLGDQHGNIHRLDQTTGAVRASIPVGGTFLGPPITIGDSLVLFAGDRAIVCLDLATASVRWAHTLERLSSSRPYLWRGSVLAATVKGELFAFRAVDGTPLWSRTFVGMVRGIGQGDRTLYLGTQEGMVYAYTRAGQGASSRR